MQQGIEAYAKNAKTTLSPRDLEATVLLNSAALLQEVKDTWPENSSSLNDILTHNRKIWTLFASAVSEDDSPLPQDVRNNVGSLAVFVFKHTVTTMATPSPEKIETLIGINRQIANGLMDNG